MTKNREKIIFCPNRNVRTKMSTDFFSNKFFHLFLQCLIDRGSDQRNEKFDSEIIANLNEKKSYRKAGFFFLDKEIST